MQQAFKKENADLLKLLIEGLHKNLDVNASDMPGHFDTSIELFLTTACNQKCNYCYLQKHSEELYPQECNNKPTILKNLRLLLDYYLEQGYSFNRMDLFSGEIWGYPFGNEVLDIILSYMRKGLKISAICIPTNASFCSSQKLIAIMRSYMTQFKMMDASLLLSLSYDGPIMDLLNRPSCQWSEKDEQYIDNLMNFAKDTDLGFHPMISFHNIEHQIENYKAWTALIQKYFPRHPMRNFGMIMQLETREHGWSTEKIIEYLKWLKYLIDTDLHTYFLDNKTHFTKFINNQIDPNLILEELGIVETRNSWVPYLPYKITENLHDGALGCSLGRNLVVRVGDLAIVPCHRTCYPKLVIGHYEVENEHIVDISCDNYSVASAIYVTGFKTKPFCNECALNYSCARYCCGANYEQHQELFYPEEDNCNLQKAKIIFLHLYYTKLNIDNPSTKAVFTRLRESEPEVVNRWSTIIQSLI